MMNEGSDVLSFSNRPHEAFDPAFIVLLSVNGSTKVDVFYQGIYTTSQRSWETVLRP
jgi:hypothetical protein